MTRRLIAATNVVSDAEQPDVSALLNHVTVLHQASDALLERLEYENQSCLTQSKAMMDLSHRVRDSLSVILGSAWILEMHGDDLDANKRSRHCSIIRERILRLLSELEMAGQWQELDLNLQPLPINLETFVTGLIQAKHVSCETSLIQLSCEGGSRQVSCLDPGVIKLVVDELLDNALKFSNKERPISVQMTVAEKQVQIAVRDEGMGISLAEQQRIFEPFYRAKNSLSYEGLGLGLSIVRKVVAQCGGSIFCKSELGQGARFFVVLPLSSIASMSL